MFNLLINYLATAISNTSHKNRVCLGLVILCVIADTNLLFHERSPSRYLLLRLLIDLVSIGSVFCVGGWLAFSRGLISKFFLVSLTVFTVLDCVYAHIIGRITSSSLLLVSAVLEPGSDIRKGYEIYIILAAVIIIISSFLLRTKYQGLASLKRYFGWSAFILFAVQFFIVFPTARHPASHLTVKYKGWNTFPEVGYPGWGFKPGVAMDYLLPQLRSLPGVVGDILSIVALQIDQGTLPIPRVEKKFPDFIDKTSLKQPLANTIILVVGESSAAQHWGLYGAKSRTTPGLSKLYAKHKINYITKSHSASDMTRLAVLPQISMWSPNNLKADRKYENVIELAKDRGYKTFFLSGAWDLGQWSGDIGQIGETADVVRVNGPLSQGKSTCIDDPKRDHPWFTDNDAFVLAEKVLNDPAEKKLIIIHQQGSHWPYESDDIDKQALPKVSTYDLTIHKTDRLLAHLIDRLDKIDSKSSNLLIYTSDHGEAVNGKYSAHYNMQFKGNDYLIPVVIAGTAEGNIAKLADELRAPDGWYSSNMNKYLVLRALGYYFTKSSIGIDAQTDNIIAADDNLYDWVKYYQPEAILEK